MFAKEVKYLKWVYEKKLRILPKGGSSKKTIDIMDKLDKIVSPGVGRDFFHFPVDISREGLAIIKKYQERMSAEYTLDYSIWQFQLLES
jgi:hypothetical protein